VVCGMGYAKSGDANGSLPEEDTTPQRGIVAPATTCLARLMLIPILRQRAR